jgi:phage baseplate assembly protein W
VSIDFIGRGWSFPPQINARGGLALADRYEDIAEAIHIILSSVPGERVMRPTFGSRLHELVFASINSETMALARRYVQDALGMWEPRIEIIDIVVSPDGNANNGCLIIDINYVIRATNDRRNLVYPLYLIPNE